jgi:hypothetical protein
MNLKTKYGSKYKITIEDGTEKNDPAGFQIPCKFGHIYCHGEKLLGVSTNHPGRLVQRLAKLPGVTLLQDGSDGSNLSFPPAAFQAVAKVMRPRTRRKLSPAHKAKLLAASKPFKRAATPSLAVAR